ncbi:unnamed protein product [Macrosiphum euphorbiae]|uniref:Uncharacterized protein n=1 Tax=Macrosiphum euphorbiae TaxID=13131 RepID=A0AAV0WYQ4_9HEMI|nr:unnamed protein product [Macrosiphum euphorbiae]
MDRQMWMDLITASIFQRLVRACEHDLRNTVDTTGSTEVVGKTVKRIAAALTSCSLRRFLQVGPPWIWTIYSGPVLNFTVRWPLSG